MRNFTKLLSIATSLFAVALFLQSCTDQGSQFEKQKVQFLLCPTSITGAAADDIALPENARARISVTSSNGASVLSDHEISVFKTNGVYITDAVDLSPGAYTITDFMIVKDSVALYLTPKKGAELTTATPHALPYKFSVGEANAATVSMQVIDVRDLDLELFGYASAKARNNSLAVAIYDSIDGNTFLTSATAELRQNKKLLSTFSLAAAVNTITLGGDHKMPYTLTVYTANSAKTRTFNIKDLKHEIGNDPLQLVLKPAFVLKLESYIEAGNETEEYFEFRMDGQGKVNINWGDGEESPATILPFQISHEYFAGSYTAIVTGDLDQIGDFSGFSYGTIIYAITGLTHLTSLRVYDPSWGAVPIKVDLSNCKQLERIGIAKYGAPYETIDLRTDFKLPAEHYITVFSFDATSFDSTREYISAEELDAMLSNIYNNVVARQIYNGTFLVNPVVAPSAETQQKIDILKNQYNWRVSFNDDIYIDYGINAGRSATSSDPNAAREQWLRERFSNSEQIIQRGKAFAVN
jgi:hypothetical protein